jgi:hypothetical protein
MKQQLCLKFALLSCLVTHDVALAMGKKGKLSADMSSSPGNHQDSPEFRTDVFGAQHRVSGANPPSAAAMDPASADASPLACLATPQADELNKVILTRESLPIYVFTAIQKIFSDFGITHFAPFMQSYMLTDGVALPWVVDCIEDFFPEKIITESTICWHEIFGRLADVDARVLPVDLNTLAAEESMRTALPHEIEGLFMELMVAHYRSYCERQRDASVETEQRQQKISFSLAHQLGKMILRGQEGAAIYFEGEILKPWAAKAISDLLVYWMELAVLTLHGYDQEDLSEKQDIAPLISVHDLHLFVTHIGALLASIQSLIATITYPEGKIQERELTSGVTSDEDAIIQLQILGFMNQARVYLTKIFMDDALVQERRRLRVQANDFFEHMLQTFPDEVKATWYKHSVTGRLLPWVAQYIIDTYGPLLREMKTLGNVRIAKELRKSLILRLGEISKKILRLDNKQEFHDAVVEQQERHVEINKRKRDKRLSKADIQYMVRSYYNAIHTLDEAITDALKGSRINQEIASIMRMHWVQYYKAQLPDCFVTCLYQEKLGLDLKALAVPTSGGLEYEFWYEVLVGELVRALRTPITNEMIQAEIFSVLITATTTSFSEKLSALTTKRRKTQEIIEGLKAADQSVALTERSQGSNRMLEDLEIREKSINDEYEKNIKKIFAEMVDAPALWGDAVVKWRDGMGDRLSVLVLKLRKIKDPAERNTRARQLAALKDKLYTSLVVSKQMGIEVNEEMTALEGWLETTLSSTEPVEVASATVVRAPLAWDEPTSVMPDKEREERGHWEEINALVEDCASHPQYKGVEGEWRALQKRIAKLERGVNWSNDVIGSVKSLHKRIKAMKREVAVIVMDKQRGARGHWEVMEELLKGCSQHPSHKGFIAEWATLKSKIAKGEQGAQWTQGVIDQVNSLHTKAQAIKVEADSLAKEAEAKKAAAIAAERAKETQASSVKATPSLVAAVVPSHAVAKRPTGTPDSKATSRSLAKNPRTPQKSIPPTKTELTTPHPIEQPESGKGVQPLPKGETLGAQQHFKRDEFPPLTQGQREQYQDPKVPDNTKKILHQRNESSTKGAQKTDVGQSSPPSEAETPTPPQQVVAQSAAKDPVGFVFMTENSLPVEPPHAPKFEKTQSVQEDSEVTRLRKELALAQEKTRRAEEALARRGSEERHLGEVVASPPQSNAEGGNTPAPTASYEGVTVPQGLYYPAPTFPPYPQPVYHMPQWPYAPQGAALGNPYDPYAAYRWPHHGQQAAPLPHQFASYGYPGYAFSTGLANSYPETFESNSQRAMRIFGEILVTIAGCGDVGEFITLNRQKMMVLLSSIEALTVQTSSVTLLPQRDKEERLKQLLSVYSKGQHSYPAQILPWFLAVFNAPRSQNDTVVTISGSYTAKGAQPRDVNFNLPINAVFGDWYVLEDEDGHLAVLPGQEPENKADYQQVGNIILQGNRALAVFKQSKAIVMASSKPLEPRTPPKSDPDSDDRSSGTSGPRTPQIGSTMSTPGQAGNNGGGNGLSVTGQPLGGNVAALDWGMPLEKKSNGTSDGEASVDQNNLNNRVRVLFRALGS